VSQAIAADDYCSHDHVTVVHGWNGRLFTKMTPRRWLAGLAVIGALTTPLWWAPAKEPARLLRDFPVRQARARNAADSMWFGHLAASQIGYAPAAPKAFTSPRPFSSFTVINQDTGETAWTGGNPTQIASDKLGPVTTVWTGDFTPLATPGQYRVVADNGLSSHPFYVGPGVLDGAVRAVQRVFYFQRAFTGLTAVHAEGPWIHESDEALAPPGVRRGWHDAGDFSIYNMTAVSSLFWLLESYSDFTPQQDDTNIPESANGVPDLLDEARWGLDWLLSVEDGQGGFANTTCLSEYRTYGDNQPETAARYHSGEIGTMATARAVGVLAYASMVYESIDPPYARRLREAASRGWRFLEARPDEHSDGPTCDAYRQNGDRRFGRAVRMFAAAGMLAATGAPRFHESFEAHFDDIFDDPSAYRFNAYACLLYLRAAAGDTNRKASIRARLREHANRVLVDAGASPFAWAGRYFWGSIGAGFERTGAFNVKICLLDPVAEAAHCRQALANLDYMLGRNSYQFVYVSGLPGVVQGRRHAFHHWLATLRATPFLYPGAVAGGPNESPEPEDGSRPRARPTPVWGYWDDPAMPRSAATPIDGRFTDNDSWSTNEIAIGWQAVTLYNLYFGQWAARTGAAQARAR